MSTRVGTAELLDPLLADKPREWDDDLTDAAGRPIDPATLLPPAGTRILTPDQRDALWALSARRWFLLRNVHRFRSRGTGRVEEHFTYGGVPRPFNGLASLVAHVQVVIDGEPSFADMDRMLSELVRVGAIEPITTEYAGQLLTAILARTGLDLSRATQKGAW